MSNSHPRRQLDAAIAAQRSGRSDEAERIYGALLEHSEVAVAARFNLACMQLEQGRLAEAAAGLAEALAADPANPYRNWAVREMGLALFNAGFLEPARPWLEEARVAQPEDRAVQAAWARSRPPAWLAPEVYDPGLGRTLLRAAPREGGSYVYTIDIVGTCNLRCPSCPVGNLTDSDRPKGFMPLANFRRIVDKIVAESPVADPEIWLFNWGEPLLHPELPAMIGELDARGLASFLSTNLNIKKGLEATVAAGPTRIKISMSGFSEATYATTHERGKLALLRENLHRLRELIDRYGVDTRVWVGQHVYKNNLDEVEPVAELCRELGFEHRPGAAFFQPLEKLMALSEGETLPDDEPVLELLVEHPRDYLPRIAAGKDRRFDCELRANQTVINHDGQVALCCSVYEPENMLGLDFLDTPREAIEAAKYRHPTCTRCQNAGLAYAPSRLAINAS
jgi:MoaA/NifB/PqqE/SkfB family radical SAM enzyme